MANTHYFTSIATNYLPKARILARSIRRHDADATIHLVLCDVPPPGFDLNGEPFDHLHLVHDLGIPNLMSWLFQHDLVEMCTGVKGPALWKILTEYQADQVYYFDPDIVVFDNLDGLKAQLAEASVVLTPHVTVPEERADAIEHNEVNSLRHGVYNLGFLGVRPTEDGLAFARWWRDRLLTHCFADIANGLFTDQRWVDLAPAMFDGVRILRDKQYNVATWNLTHREAALSSDGTLMIDGKPIVFFHFSGFDAGGQLLMLKHYAPPESPLFELHDWYVREMDKEGQTSLGKIPPVYGCYFNGQPVDPTHRRLYRSRPDLQQRFTRPFDVDAEYSLYDWMKTETARNQLRSAAAASPSSGAVHELQSTITWRVGKMITDPIERAASLVPGWVPALKQRFRR